jgi:hypothetical protein
MKTLTKTQVGFKITILVEQISCCPDWIGDEDRYLVNYELTAPLYEILPLEYLQERGFSLDMKEEEQCEWLSNILGHQEVYERIADEYGEDVNDFYEEGSCIDFSVTGIEMKIW